jgi:2-polyprenyl-3-methyl-5-hydroxy-6-metoxy-1,4-benzoquinol methylase
MSTPVYNPSVFDLDDITAAKEIVLTPENDVSVEVRWHTETPWLLNLFSKHAPKTGSIIDYGCGVGRISAPLVQSGYSVIGVDQSETMRQHATNQVDSKTFFTVTPAQLDLITDVGGRFDIVIAIWVLQHCYCPEEEIDRIYRTIKHGGLLMIADMKHRAVPTNIGWVNDCQDINEIILKKFSLEKMYKYDASSPPQNLVDNAFIAFYKKWG